MIVSGGENVYPQEVEELLAEHPEIAEVAVVGAPDPQFGQALRAFVVTKPGMELDEDAVRLYVRERLARFKVPRTVRFVERLPRNATGKVLRRELVSA
jgi:fatty-acyl-CoA synthase